MLKLTTNTKHRAASLRQLSFLLLRSLVTVFVTNTVVNGYCYHHETFITDRQYLWDRVTKFASGSTLQWARRSSLCGAWHHLCF